MIAYVKGTLSEVGNDYIIVEVNNIGYQIKVSLRVIEALPILGSEVKMHTYTYVREDMIALYGFGTKEDLDMFLLLLSVNGVGPKGALGILSMFTSSQLKMSIVAGDHKMIAKAPGVGSKTASRLLLELKDKISLEDMVDSIDHEAASHGQEQLLDDFRKEAVEALTALGYSPAESLKAVRSIKEAEGMNSEQLLKAALRQML